MAERTFSLSGVVTQLDIAPGLPLPTAPAASDVQGQILDCLRQLVTMGKEQMELSRQLAHFAQNTHQQRQNALQRWQKENPHLVRRCRQAISVFEKVQKSFLEELTQFVIENEDGLVDGEYVLSEFSDRFGPRLMHLSGVMNLLQHLGTQEESANPSGNTGPSA